MTHSTNPVRSAASGANFAIACAHPGNHCCQRRMARSRSFKQIDLCSDMKLPGASTSTLVRSASVSGALVQDLPSLLTSLLTYSPACQLLLQGLRIENLSAEAKNKASAQGRVQGFRTDYLTTVLLVLLPTQTTEQSGGVAFVFLAKRLMPL